MNLNRLAPYRTIDRRALWWVLDGRLILISLDFDPGMP